MILFVVRLPQNKLLNPRVCTHEALSHLMLSKSRTHLCLVGWATGALGSTVAEAVAELARHELQ